jgi:hypothetical protein
VVMAMNLTAVKKRIKEARIITNQMLKQVKGCPQLITVLRNIQRVRLDNHNLERSSREFSRTLWMLQLIKGSIRINLITGNSLNSILMRASCSLVVISQVGIQGTVLEASISLSLMWGCSLGRRGSRRILMISILQEMMIKIALIQSEDSQEEVARWKKLEDKIQWWNRCRL